MDRALAASTALYDYFCAIIAERRVAPVRRRDHRARAGRARRQRLTDDEICAFLRLLLPAGAETTYRSSSNLLFGLLTNPDQLDALRADRSLMHAGDRRGAALGAAAAQHHAHRDARHRGRGRAGPGRRDRRRSTSAPRTTTSATGRTPRSSTSSARRGSTSRSRWVRTCASGCTSRGWRRRVLLTQLLDRLPNLRLDPDAEAAAHHRHDVPRAADAARRVGLTSTVD